MVIGRIFIAGVIGALILSIGFYLILSEFNGQLKLLEEQFPDQGRDMGPGSLFYAFLGIVLFILSAYVTGFFANFFTKNIVSDVRAELRGRVGWKDRLASDIIYSFAAGLIAGILTWLAYSIISAINVFGISNLPIVLTTILDRFVSTAPFFIIVALAFAIFCIFGGFFYELTFVIIKRYSGKNV